MDQVVAASPANSPEPSELPFHRRVYEPVTEEHDCPLAVTGELPEALRGTLYRNGPARWEAGEFRAGHLFDGDGMLTQFTFDGGTLHYRNRFVRTPKYLAGNRGSAVRGLGSQRPGGALKNALRMVSDRANTHAVIHAERLLALTDDGRPWRLDLDTLETLGRCNFAGHLPAFSLFSPHPRIDPQTGEMFNFGLAPMPGPATLAGLRCYRVDPAGRMKTLRTVPLKHLYINHDFAITERYLVFVLAPVVIKPSLAVSAVLGRCTFEDASGYRSEIGTRVVLVPRDGSEPRTIECPPLVYVHFNNAYEERDEVLIDLVRYDAWDPLAHALRNFRDTPPPIAGKLTRLRVSARDKVTIEELCDLGCEFPQHDTRRTSRPHRYGYVSGQVGAQKSAIIKVDHRDGKVQECSFGEHSLPGEPLFVPRSPDASEDDGFLLSLVYFADAHRTALVVLDARHVAAGPLASADLPAPVFPGFHGSFTPRIARKA